MDRDPEVVHFASLSRKPIDLNDQSRLSVTPGLIAADCTDAGKSADDEKFLPHHSQSARCNDAAVRAQARNICRGCQVRFDLVQSRSCFAS
jgi:hypothetical protein